MKVYISGPITNQKNADYKFRLAEKTLRKEYMDVEIVNPIDIPYPKMNQEDWGRDGVWRYFMHESLKLMMECDTIYMLQGWSASRGAVIEHNLAHDLEMRVMYEDRYNEIENDETNP